MRREIYDGLEYACSEPDCESLEDVVVLSRGSEDDGDEGGDHLSEVRVEVAHESRRPLLKQSHRARLSESEDWIRCCDLQR